MRIVLYGNGTAENHGCEAIVRGTAEMLPVETKMLLLSENKEIDEQYGLRALMGVALARTDLTVNFRFLLAYLKLKLWGKYVELDGLYYLPTIKQLSSKVDVALSIGGDNYCYGGTEIYAWLNKAYRKRGIKTVLWGCSVEPDVVIQPRVSQDLANYHLIVARESITYEAISKVQKKTVLAPDPAFYMKPIECEIDERFESGNVIGLNISPMIISEEKSIGVAYENYRCLITYILQNTNSYVALIPHVIWKDNDDRVVLQRLYEEFDRNPRLILVEDHTAPELKYIISRCNMFVGARTHATIAAYSTCVPTLVVGYSVKARGIARDLFGSETGHVLSVQELERPEELTQAFITLHSRRWEIREHLKNVLPDYLRAGEEAAKAIERLIQ